MAGSGPHQENPHQADPQQTEPIGPQQQNNPPDPEPNLGNGRNREEAYILLRQAKATPK